MRPRRVQGRRQLPLVAAYRAAFGFHELPGVSVQKRGPPAIE